MTATEAVHLVLAIFETAPDTEGSENTCVDGLIEMAEVLLPLPSEEAKRVLTNVLRENVDGMFCEGWDGLPDSKLAFRMSILVAIDYSLMAGFLLEMARLKQEDGPGFAGLRELLSTGDALRAAQLVRLAQR